MAMVLPALAVESAEATLVANLAVDPSVVDLVAMDSPEDVSAPESSTAAWRRSLGRTRETFLGDRGWGYPEGTLRGGLHDRHHHFHERFVGVPGYYYDDYGYGLDDYPDNNACFQYRHVYTTSGSQWRQVWICN
jgi:hypothetical protein